MGWSDNRMWGRLGFVRPTLPAHRRELAGTPSFAARLRRMGHRAIDTIREAYKQVEEGEVRFRYVIDRDPLKAEQYRWALAGSGGLAGTTGWLSC